MKIESDLFKMMEIKEIDDFIRESKSFTKRFLKDEYIFMEGDQANYLYLLLKGGVQVEKIDGQGKRVIINKFMENGTIFGEVYLYLDKVNYDYSCLSYKDSEILFIPKNALDLEDSNTPCKRKINKNMLRILSEKAYSLNEKILILSSFTLREKIITMLLQKSNDDKRVNLNLSREEMADYIGVTRPSLSRELMKMQEDGLIEIDNRKIKLNIDKIKNYL